MIKRLSKYIVPAVVISVLIYFIIGGVWREKKDQEIKRDGIYHQAIVTGKTVSKGNTSSFYYQYKFEGKKYKFERYVSESFYKQHEIGDTILIKVLSNEPSQSIIVEKKF